MLVVAPRKWAWQRSATRRAWVLGCIVKGAEPLVPKHTFPLIGICGIAAHHELEVVVVLLRAGEVVQLIIQAHIISANEGRSTHIGAVQDENTRCERDFGRR